MHSAGEDDFGQSETTRTTISPLFKKHQNKGIVHLILICASDILFACTQAVVTTVAFLHCNHILQEHDLSK